jgi:hypothetical protein
MSTSCLTGRLYVMHVSHLPKVNIAHFGVLFLFLAFDLRKIISKAWLIFLDGFILSMHMRVVSDTSVSHTSVLSLNAMVCRNASDVTPTRGQLHLQGHVRVQQTRPNSIRWPHLPRAQTIDFDHGVTQQLCTLTPAKPEGAVDAQSEIKGRRFVWVQDFRPDVRLRRRVEVDVDHLEFLCGPSSTCPEFVQRQRVH